MNVNIKKRKNTVLVSILVLLLFSIGLTGCTSITKENESINKAENSTTSDNSSSKKLSDESTNKLEDTTNPINKESSGTEENTADSNDSADNKSSSNIENNVDSSNFDPYKKDGKKVVYLTFDDGPSTNNTPKILDTLKQYDVKATFFLIGKNAEQNPELVKKEVAQGHAVGNHTYSHDMSYIYSNPKIFMQEIYKCQSVLSSILGENYNLKLVRFPGGSFGDRLKPFREEVIKNGYHYVDWNDLSGDAEHNNVSVENLIYKTKKYAIYDHLVVLMHDAPAKVTTVQALPAIIEYFKSQGYSFETLK
ncbi:MAG: polysaccharide deacetylase [Clostridium sp.]|jgi:peptidoglycan/xylan/chitin deacetylase (PgdA/CDA1 family)|uniref:polysaccharide deacetylase family protein n=1 Tax=Clostridium sp. TaxID=1506 RepID=UPI0025BCAC00|nr:polysaccharide deacetylase family protein [Clostridium sp.]MCH3963042.1 polysaccharide deacetylase [Clostridium sp.]MCI1716495.1 polysaccharide deacetylase [Clostridium sp.]MCI1800835.1 polysaccharide deacetylase [Clostridium sp.]MCI1814510.1 polysaccharide deacetylase [Clostridium sp.]MCI1871420.1 polysaccharide deacetylase [Clostridium sp.]